MFSIHYSLRKRPFLPALHRWGRFVSFRFFSFLRAKRTQRRRARRNGCFCRLRFGKQRYQWGGTSNPSSPLPFLDHGSAAKVLITHRDNTASYAGYRTFRHLICVNHIKITRYTSQPWNFTAYSELSKFIRLKIVLTFFSWMLVVIAHSLSSRGGKGDREGIPHTHPIP